MAFDLKGKIVLITGGASGIGFRCIKELLRCGAQAATIAEIDEKRGHDAVKELTAEFGPNRVLFVKTDVTNADQLEAAFKATIDTWRCVDVVINNAGIMTEAQWQLEISLNCIAVVQGTFLAYKYMGKDNGGKGGVVVNMASVLGLRLLDCLPVYCGTKHFVAAFSRCMGLPYHYDRTGVKVLTLCPGGTNTNLISAAIQHPLGNNAKFGERLDEIIKGFVMQPPEKVAEAMAKIIAIGESGTVWVIEEGTPVYKIDIPDRKTLNNK